jgi:hypothetical protein
MYSTYTSKHTAPENQLKEKTVLSCLEARISCKSVSKLSSYFTINTEILHHKTIQLMLHRETVVFVLVTKKCMKRIAEIHSLFNVC